MLFQEIDYLEILSVIVSAIVKFLQPIVTPIGELMVLWINIALTFFPKEKLFVYIVVFILLVSSGVLVNWIWSGDK